MKVKQQQNNSPFFHKRNNLVWQFSFIGYPFLLYLNKLL